MRRYAFEGGTAVVTGAASGIGAALVAGLAARGSNLVLLDRDADGLAAVAAAARAMPTGVRVAEHIADLANPAAAVAAGEAIAAAHPETTLLINNAGAALAGRFDQVDAAQFDAVIAVNFRAVVHPAHFCPTFLGQRYDSIGKLQNNQCVVVAFRLVLVNLRRHLRVNGFDGRPAEHPAEELDGMATHVHRHTATRSINVPEVWGVRAVVFFGLFQQSRYAQGAAH